MSLTSAGAVLVGIFIGSTIYTVSTTIRFVKHRMLVRDMQQNGDVLVEGSLQRDNVPIIATIAIVVFLLCYMLSRRKFFAMNLMLAVSFGLYVLSNVLTIGKLGLNVLQGDVCYLTKRGLICYDFCADWAECRLAWEAPATEGAITNTLYVYKNESKVPIIVRFNYKYDEAHRVVERFGLGVRYNGYMEEEEFKQRPKVTDGKLNG